MPQLLKRGFLPCNRLAPHQQKRLPAEQPLSVPLRQRLDSILIVSYWVAGKAPINSSESAEKATAQKPQ